ncbi:ABC transporter ATP-binding protein [Algoriphagus kandeliae]|uniref:ABC transporter ATP-binding protein n=1 Tax=Algoriphagus kandeliae TaxID=2562278 RepID=A0A4Y9QLC8_9BACT|nr:ABC transporter ATP-binding protein [Algoriphagus kandeliae]TFV93060.1 ABC transporter ATP-binding protein [Algoriphagus kandeliae]
MKKQVLIGKNLSLGYEAGNQQKTILSNLDFELLSGQMTCLLGPNGVGKSTLIKAIMGKIEPFKGSIELFGSAPTSYHRDDLSKKLSVVLSEPIFPAQMTVKQLVALGRTPYLNWSGRLSDQDKNEVYKALEATKLEYLRKERLGELSDGQRQKAMIARALAQDCPLMVLDEPTSHLDLVNRYEVMQLLQDIAKTQEKAVLVVTHDLDIAIETGQQLWILNCGSPLISGTPEDLILQGEINQLLPSDKYFFDSNRGKVVMHHQTTKIEIEGPDELVYWVEKALIKSGKHLPKDSIRISENPFRIFCQGKEFTRISELIEIL